MNVQQVLHFNLAKSRGDKLEKELAESKIREQELKNQLAALQNQKLQEMEQQKHDYEKLAEQKHNLLQNEHAQNIATLKNEHGKQIADLQKANLDQQIITTEVQHKNEKLFETLKKKEDEYETIKKCYEKLQVAANEMAKANHSLKVATDVNKDNLKTLKNSLTKFKEAYDNNAKKVSLQHHARRIVNRRYVPYDIASASTKRRILQKTLKQVENVPEMKEKIAAHLIPIIEKSKAKITPIQAVLMAVSLGFNPNQVEQMKTFLRFFGLDVLPPVHLLRKILKALKEDFEYLDFEDKELGVVGRRIIDVKKVIIVRWARIIEIGKWIDVPGFEGFGFAGLTSDSG